MADAAEPRARRHGRAERPDRPLSAVGLGVIALVLIVDQIAKFLADRYLDYGVAGDLLPILSLYRVHNPGLAFSMLAGFGTLGLIGFTLAITVVVLLFWTRAHDGGRLAAIGYAFIIGGAVGNLIDRIRVGYVIDFLLLHFGEVALFVFNLADTALTIGPLLLILAYVHPPSQAG
jgi:signal peptidase II